jgi:peptidylprolyl isomerase
MLTGCSQESADKQEATPAADTVLNEQAPIIANPSGVRYQDLRVGTGREIKDSMYITHSYVVWFADKEGTKKEKYFRSSGANQQPYYGQVGVTHLKGLSDGIMGMREGGRRRVFIPMEMGYGNKTPFGGSNLIFEIDSLKVVSRLDVQEYQDNYNPKSFRDSILSVQARKDSLKALGLDSLGRPLENPATGK